MSELHDKARALLALRDKAEKWHHVHMYAGEELIVSDSHGDPIGHFRSQSNAEFCGKAHDMAYIIRELLAENKRLIALWQALCDPEVTHTVAMHWGKQCIIRPNMEETK